MLNKILKIFIYPRFTHASRLVHLNIDQLSKHTLGSIAQILLPHGQIAEKTTPQSSVIWKRTNSKIVMSNLATTKIVK